MIKIKYIHAIMNHIVPPFFSLHIFGRGIVARSYNKLATYYNYGLAVRAMRVPNGIGYNV